MLGAIHHIVSKPVAYLRDKLSARQFFILSSIFVGLSSGAAAITLKYFVHSIAAFVRSYAVNYEGFVVFAALPLVGILLAVLFVKYALRNNFKKGTAEIVYAIVKKSSILPTQQMYSNMITSALTVGFGGSTGLESPMVTTGAAFGSNFARTYNLSYKDRTILLGCGAAAGIAAAFNAPIAGVLFAVEVILTDVSVTAFVPLIIAAACGALLSKVVVKQGVILAFTLQQPFSSSNVPYYIILGVLAGLMSLYFAEVFGWIEKRIKSVQNVWLRILVGGLSLFVLLILFPPLFGEGYTSIEVLAKLQSDSLIDASILRGFINSEGVLLLFLGALMFLKTVAAAVTLGSGGNGGSFGPSLFVGAYLGYIFSSLVNMTGIAHIPVTNFTLVGMAGILSGVFYAPLTAIFLIAEITSGYELMIPLMIVSALSNTVAHYFEPLSMEAKKLSSMLNLTVENRDKFLLSKLDLSALIETNFSVLGIDEPVQSLIKVISSSNRNTFPVVNPNRELMGIIHMDNIRSIIFSPEKYEKLTVKDLTTKPAATIALHENLDTVLKKFDDTSQWNLPVVDNGKYVGFVSKSSVLTRYRSELLKSV
ncbi:chloride channel protein [Chryseolinea sp. T2]|uniref:chloride channel protein n=1 Tax=Chryseolinea sp. T2 TaxID=3129255 RepID=UPI003077C108